MSRFHKPYIAAADPISIVKRALPTDLPIKVTGVLPRLKEGGAFVKFSHEPQVQVANIENTVRDYLKDEPIKPWFNPWRRVRSFLVMGRPWIEDLHRYPSEKLKVEFLPITPGGEAIELSQEILYSLFRKYGKIADIVPQPLDSKAVPKFASIKFRLTRHSIMAKNCMHGFTVVENEGGGKAGTVLRLAYEQKAKAHWYRDWLINHPRIVIPIVAALIATFTMAIFDPYVPSTCSLS